MSKPKSKPGSLFHLKPWLSVYNAAEYLSSILDEPVSASDLYQLALDGHLKISARFASYHYVTSGSAVPVDDVETILLPSLDGTGSVAFFPGTRIANDRAIVWGNTISRISGIWDLSMYGAERIDVENAYQRSLGRHEIDLVNIDGPMLEGPDGIFCKIVERFDRSARTSTALRSLGIDDYYPSNALPDDCQLVIRSAELRALTNRMSRLSVRTDDDEWRVAAGERLNMWVFRPAVKREADRRISERLTKKASVNGVLWEMANECGVGWGQGSIATTRRRGF